MSAAITRRMKKQHFGQVVPAGHVTHVAPVIGRYVVMNAFDPIQPMSSAYVYEWYTSRDYDVEWRGLDIEALRQHSRDRDLVYGVDPVLQQIRPA